MGIIKQNQIENPEPDSNVDLEYWETMQDKDLQGIDPVDEEKLKKEFHSFLGTIELAGQELDLSPMLWAYSEDIWLIAFKGFAESKGLYQDEHTGLWFESYEEYCIWADVKPEPLDFTGAGGGDR